MNIPADPSEANWRSNILFVIYLLNWLLNQATNYIHHDVYNEEKLSRMK